jgi:hypothetical protein
MTRWLLLCAGAALLGASTSDDEVTYREHIAPIIARRCLPCHNVGEAGAFPLTNYAEVRRRASLIRWVVMAGSMPPTKVESDDNPLTAGYLSDEEKVLLQEWVRTGMKEGVNAPRPAPPAPMAWRIESPDARLKPREQVDVAAEGTPYRRLFVLDPELTEPKQLAAFDVRPESPFAVRQAWVAVVRKGDDDFAETRIFGREGLDSKALVGAWAPGYPHWRSETGITLQPGDRLAVAVLYQPTGRAEPAGFELGVRYAPANAKQASWVRLGRAEGTLAPGDGVQTLHDEIVLDQERKLRGFIPECREFARQVRVLAVESSGKRRTLLRINAWDMNWIGAYQWPESIRLPKGMRVRVEIDYDNSGHSAGGRELLPIDPVKFGPGMKDELFWVHLQFD